MPTTTAPTMMPMQSNAPMPISRKIHHASPPPLDVPGTTATSAGDASLCCVVVASLLGVPASLVDEAEPLTGVAPLAVLAVICEPFESVANDVDDVEPAGDEFVPMPVPVGEPAPGVASTAVVVGVESAVGVEVSPEAVDVGEPSFAVVVVGEPPIVVVDAVDVAVEGVVGGVPFGDTVVVVAVVVVVVVVAGVVVVVVVEGVGVAVVGVGDNVVVVVGTYVAGAPAIPNG
jgi:hypothetical protein